jgi:spore maturation protein CgeB
MKEYRKLKKKIFFAAWACTNKKWHTYQLWDGPLRRAFKEVVVFDPKVCIEKYGKEEMNKRFLQGIEKEKPDYLFLWTMYDEFDPKTLFLIKKISPNTKSFCYNGDDDYKFFNYTLFYFNMIDYFFTTQPEFIKIFKKFGKQPFFGCGCDIEKFKPVELEKDIDVSFVGTPKNDRIEYLRYLINNKINVKVFGAGWEKYPEFKDNYGGEIPEEEFIKVINRSKINICLSKNYFGGVHILERFFEINACKSFCLTEHAPGYDHIFQEGIDIVTFKNKQELLEKTRFYLTNSKRRQLVTNKAYIKTINNFSNDVLLKNLLNSVEKQKPNKRYLPPDLNKEQVCYLGEKDLYLREDILRNEIAKVEYIGFRTRRSKNLPYKEFFQIFGLSKTGKPISCCDNYIHSSLIGDFASLCLYYAYDLSNKKYFYSNLDPSQLIVKKDYFLKNLEKFRNLFSGQDPSFINKDNTSFVSIPLVRLSKKTILPIENIEHVLFDYFNRELMVLKNNRVYFSVYYLKLLLYSIIINPKMIKLITIHTFRRTKNKALIRISNFLSKL